MFLNTSWKHPLAPMIALRPVQTSNNLSALKMSNFQILLFQMFKV